MYLKKIHIENYRLLQDVTIDLDNSLTLFVGKNNTGKTSIMNLIELVLSQNAALAFDDYPLDCRQKLYQAVSDYWEDTTENPFLNFQKAVPVTKIMFYIDYKDGEMGEVSDFVIDLDENVTVAVIEVSFDVNIEIEKTLLSCKEQYDSLISLDSTEEDRIKCIHSVIRNQFSKFFCMNVAAVNPSNQEDICEKRASSLRELFFLKVIHAERNMDESENANNNPLGQVMRTLFDTEISDMESNVQDSMSALQTLVNDTNYNLQEQVNVHMAKIVESMMPFGYPAADDMNLRADTSIELKRRIIEDTKLTYFSGNINETLPSSHNGLGYKNLIKISMELHNFAREVKSDRTKLPLLFIEEPEAHMHPQLQTTFVSFVEDFMKKQVGEATVQVIMTTHSAHVANTVDFKKVRYIKRHANRVSCKAMADFPVNGGDQKEYETRLDFLQKYMKLSYCDLYFCDKAILVEGASERLLLPDMIRKCNDAGYFNDAVIPLTSQYYTIAEVGGAYAHNFYDFMDYLEIPTLILTDIDYVCGDHNKACKKEEAIRSSNGAINHWCRRVLGMEKNGSVPIASILGLTEEQHSDGFRHIEFEKEENNFYPRSLEDAIINCNRELFGLEKGKEPCFVDTGEKKTDFALKLLVESRFQNYTVPSYIRDGLIWLNNQARSGEN